MNVASPYFKRGAHQYSISTKDSFSDHTTEYSV